MKGNLLCFNNNIIGIGLATALTHLPNASLFISTPSAFSVFFSKCLFAAAADVARVMAANVWCVAECGPGPRDPVTEGEDARPR